MDAPTPGPRDHLITRELRRGLDRIDPALVEQEALDAAEGPERLARHAMAELRRELGTASSADEQARQLNALLRQADGENAIDAEIDLPPRVLQGIRRRSPLGDVAPLPALPATPFSQSDLLVNAEGQPNIGSEL